MERASDPSARIRQAVSIVLRRDDDRSVYLVRRNPSLRFFGGFWAFPGGGLHEVDHRLADRLQGVEPRLAPYVVAALREGFEELGIALGPALRAADRVALIDDPAHFATMLPRDAQEVSCEQWIRLLTPPFSPIRFDTAFLAFDAREEPRIVEGELVDGRWAPAEQWLQEWTAGSILIAPPVLLILRLLATRQGQALRDALCDLEADFAAGELHPIHYNPAVQLLPLLTPTLPPATHTNAYLVGDRVCYLVDPATPHPDEQQRLERALRRSLTQGRELVAILLTHHHPDHVGAVEFARRHFNVPVWAHATTAALLRGQIAIDRELTHGERLPLGSTPDGKPAWELECLFTPGHAAGHLCFHERRYGSLLCGDMMSTLSSILVHPDDGDMALYMRSLRALADQPELRMIYPAHGPASAAGATALREQLAHRERREVAIAAAIEAGAADLAAIVARVYADVPPAMHGYAALSVRSVLRKRIDEGLLSPQRIRA